MEDDESDDEFQEKRDESNEEYQDKQVSRPTRRAKTIQRASSDAGVA